MAIDSLLGLAQNAGRLITGQTAALRALQSGRVKLLLLAEDASPRLAKKVRQAAAEAGTAVHVWGTKEQIGSAVGKRDLGVLAVCDDGFAGAMRKALRRDEP